MKYSSVLDQLKELHANQMRQNVAENPALIGESLIKMRQVANLILPFINQAIDQVSELEEFLATKRQDIYEADLVANKTPSGAQINARELTRLDEAKLAIAKNEISKLRNDYERFNSLCLALQSRLREFSSERIMEGRS